MSEELGFARFNPGYFHQSESPSCWTCKHAVYHKGYPGTRFEPPEPAYMECGIDWLNLDLDMFLKLDEVAWSEEKCPSICGKYEPNMIVGICPCGCENKINSPESNHPYVAPTYYGDPVPVASVQCLERMQTKCEQEEAQYKRIDDMYDNLKKMISDSP